MSVTNISPETDYAQVVYMYEYRLLVIGAPEGVKEISKRLKMLKGVFVGDKNEAGSDATRPNPLE